MDTVGEAGRARRSRTGEVMATEAVAAKFTLGTAGTLKAESVDKVLESMSQESESDVLEA